ncbi:hypothetical protein JXM67_04110 [candidate division WOR-3 bacterium]|nr:hypothetical protein [candidate division WOR-3 bacterium]
MKKIMWGILGVMLLVNGCALSSNVVTGTASSDWEQATLLRDYFGSGLVVVRQNDEVWRIESKSQCFWTSNYIGRQVWLQWGPVECVLKSESGSICEFWTKERVQ